MGKDHGQLELFSSGNHDDFRDVAPRANRTAWGAVTPGDWLLIEHEGRIVLGMIYRRRAETYMFVYWRDLVLRFARTTREHIGPWDDELTALFRGQRAVIPDYVEKCLADWVMQSNQPGRANRRSKSPGRNRNESDKVQKRLFPE